MIQKLKKFLDDEHVKYVSIVHSPAFTMSEIAAKAHISGKQVAKTVVVKLGGELALVVLPSSKRIDLRRLKDLTGASSCELAPEQDFRDRFPGCEVGAMPPFGNLYGLDVYVSPELERQDEIAFNAGNHTELIQLAYADFARLAHPKSLSLTKA